MPKGVWQRWQDIPEPARGELRAIYRDLRAEFPLRRRLAKRWAALVAESWLVTAATSKTAVLVALKHHVGRGRRPNKRELGQAAKRQWLQVDGLDQRLLRRLEQLAPARSPVPSSPAELLASMNSGTGANIPTIARLTDRAGRG